MGADRVLSASKLVGEKKNEVVKASFIESVETALPKRDHHLGRGT